MAVDNNDNAIKLVHTSSANDTEGAPSIKNTIGANKTVLPSSMPKAFRIGGWADKCRFAQTPANA